MLFIYPLWSVLQVLGHCVPEQSYDGTPVTEVATVTEVGDTLDLIRLLQMAWEDRLKVSKIKKRNIHACVNVFYLQCIGLDECAW